MVRAEEVGRVLGDGDHAEVVLARAPRHARDERPTFGIAQQRPRFVDHQKARAPLATDPVPHEVGDQMHRHRAQLFFQRLEVEDDQSPVQLDVCRSGEESTGQRAADVPPQSGRQARGHVVGDGLEDGVQVTHDRHRAPVRRGIGRDAAIGIGLVHGTIERCALVGVECRTRLGEHHVEQAEHGHNLFSEHVDPVGGRSPGRWQIEWIQVVGGAARQAHVLTFGCLTHLAVLVFRIDHQEVDSGQQVP